VAQFVYWSRIVSGLNQEHAWNLDGDLWGVQPYARLFWLYGIPRTRPIGIVWRNTTHLHLASPEAGASWQTFSRQMLRAVPEKQAIPVS